MIVTVRGVRRVHGWVWGGGCVGGWVGRGVRGEWGAIKDQAAQVLNILKEYFQIHTLQKLNGPDGTLSMRCKRRGAKWGTADLPAQLAATDHPPGHDSHNAWVCGGWWVSAWVGGGVGALVGGWGVGYAASGAPSKTRPPRFWTFSKNTFRSILFKNSMALMAHWACGANDGVPSEALPTCQPSLQPLIIHLVMIVNHLMSWCGLELWAQQLPLWNSRFWRSSTMTIDLSKTFFLPVSYPKWVAGLRPNSSLGGSSAVDGLCDLYVICR